MTLPGTLKEVGRDAFKDCPKLVVVRVGADCLVNIEWYVDIDVDVLYE